LLLLLFVVACSGTKETGETGSDSPSYALVADGLGAALFSVWGDAADNVWAVGANDGSGPLFLHYDGAAWERIDTSGLSHDFWWVWGEGDALFVGGSKGHMVHYTPSTGELTDTVIGDPALTFFGVWGADTDDIWAVAGDPTNEVSGAIFHYDGTDWTQSAEASLSEGGGVRAAFKVWGSGSSDVWVVGTSGLIMRWDGAGWSTNPSPLGSASFTTVHGRDTEVYAVGGFGNAQVMRLEAGQWVDDSPPIKTFPPLLIGVNVSGIIDPVGVGNNGALWWRRTSGWEADTRMPVTTSSYHGVWVDPDGGVWAVGGDLTMLSYGVVMYDGPATVTSYEP
jgi:hypothetical protein